MESRMQEGPCGGHGCEDVVPDDMPMKSHPSDEAPAPHQPLQPSPVPPVPVAVENVRRVLPMAPGFDCEPIALEAYEPAHADQLMLPGFLVGHLFDPEGPDQAVGEHRPTLTPGPQTRRVLKKDHRRRLDSLPGTDRDRHDRPHDSSGELRSHPPETQNGPQDQRRATGTPHRPDHQGLPQGCRPYPGPMTGERCVVHYVEPVLGVQPSKERGNTTLPGVVVDEGAQGAQCLLRLQPLLAQIEPDKV